jgi:uracil DNA glycosylase
MTTLSNRLEENWHHIVGGEFDYMAMEQFLQKEKEKVEGTIYPKDEEIFNALNLTPLENIRVVIIGQDPYPGEGQAHGLCFSTKGKDIPRSLKNIYEEIQRDCRIQMPPHGDLTKWAAQGVLLLNATLTVRKDEAGSQPGQRLGEIHRRRYPRRQQKARARRFSALGSLRSEKTRANQYRPRKTSGAGNMAPCGAFHPPLLPRLRPLQKSQRLLEKTRT